MFSEFEKIILGKLLKKYKEELNVSILEIEHYNISSISTFYNAMKGEIIKNDDFYFKYCEFFKHPFRRKKNFYKWLEKYLKELIHAFNFYEEEKFDELANEYIRELEPFKNSAIYCEYYYVFQLLFRYYLNNEYLRMQEVNEVLYLISIGMFDDELSLYLLDYIFRSNNNFIGNKDLPEKLVSEMEKIDNCHFITKYQKGFLFKYNSNFMMSLKLFEECYKDGELQNNSYRKVQSLLCIYNIYRNIDDSIEKEKANELIKLKNTEKLPIPVLVNLNYNIGMQNYLNEQYDKSYELFYENIKIHKSLTPLLFLCSICSRTNREYPGELLLPELSERYDFIYLDYFIKLYQGANDLELTHYIMNVVVPKKLKLEIYRNPYWSLFEYEMNKMALKNVKIRKYYLQFMKQFGKNVKK